MIIFHDFGISLGEYGERGKKNEFPVFDVIVELVLCS